MNEIFKDIEKELAYAEAKWGTEFDDKNTLNDWVAYSINYIGQATRMDADKEKQSAALRKSIGLLVNALIRVENGTLANRHYDQ